MEKFVIQGGAPLSGEIVAAGNKNAALPEIAACLLTEEEVVLSNVPRIRDTETQVALLERLGVKVQWSGENEIRLQADAVAGFEVDEGLSARIRASFLLAGPLLARFGQARMPPPGGDFIGRRRLDPHLDAFRDMGALVHERAHVTEGVEVRVEAPSADEVAARRRHPRLAEARQERAGEQERGPDARGQPLVHLDVRDGVGLEADLVLCRPLDLHAEPLEQRDLGLGIPDPRHVGEHHLLLGEQAGSDSRQGRVLFPAATISPESGGPPCMTNFSTPD